MHERHLTYPTDQDGKRRRTPLAGTVRYAVSWIAATTATVLALSVALHGTGEPPALLESVVERASCRLEQGGRESAGRIGVALGRSKVVVRYRATLSTAESARLRRIARRLAGRAVTIPGVPASAAAVEATAETYRLNCSRVDQHTEEALMLFVLALDDSR
jgi:hypothetical protein